MNDIWTIHAYFAEQSNERLNFVNHQPQQIILAGADGNHSHRLLSARYPQAQFHEYDDNADFLHLAANERQSGWLAKLRGKTVSQTCQSQTAPLPEASCDMLWSNLALTRADAALPVLRNWAHALKTHGLLFFTCFGRDSLADLIALLNAHGIACQSTRFLDMHDIGDMLADSGFYDPVMDSAKLQLDYRSPENFWQDLNTLGVWQALEFTDEAQRQHAQNLLNQYIADGISITLEAVFGHAVKKLVLPEGESPVQFMPYRKQS
ncbi:MAG: methyltransferase [Neisseria sp.]|nr:methyltransferase [Neisseria sp.]